jgi:hypothetical protein
MVVIDGLLYITGNDVINLDGILYEVAAWDGNKWYGVLRVNNLVFGIGKNTAWHRLCVFGGFNMANDGDPDIFVTTGGIAELEYCKTVSVTEVTHDSFTIYPNPVKHNLHIVLPESFTSNDVQV